MEKAEVIRLREGERIDIVKHEVGYSIIGPATIVVVKEEAAAVGATATNVSVRLELDGEEIQRTIFPSTHDKLPRSPV